MDAAAELFSTEELEALTPRPTLTQIMLLNCYYSARREVPQDMPVTVTVFREHLACVHYETDLAINILQKVDDKYLALRAEKQKRLSKP